MRDLLSFSSSGKIEDEMEEEFEFRQWDELIPDVLGLIFRNLSFREILTVIPRVCKSWKRAVAGPYCWQEIDMEEWSQHCCPEIVNRMLQMLVSRSAGSLRKLCISGLSNDQSFAFIAHHAKSLQTLRLPRSEISDSIVEQVSGKLSTITFLDVSYCIKIGARALEAIGRQCKFLTRLRRIMHPLEIVDKISQDDEALAIAETMPKLKHLEIAYLLVSTESVIQIVVNCRQLELLDLRGCWNVNLDEKFVRKIPGLKVVGPLVVCYERYGWDNCSDYSFDMDDYYDEMSDWFFEEDEQNNEDVEMWFYDGFFSGDDGYDWPQSP